MSLAVAFQMDPLEKVDINADSSFSLALEAQRRGHGIYHYLPSQLSYKNGRVIARARPVTLKRDLNEHVLFGKEEVIDLETLDVVLLRQDPPFNLSYISTTHLLEMVHPHTLVVNNPASVRNCPEKIFVTHFASLMPETLISGDYQEIQRFRDEFGDVVVKPLYGNGGAGVFVMRKDDPNLSSLYETLTGFLNEPLMVQRFLPDVHEGDKRIILIDGEPAGAINRIPAKGEIRANMHVGGKAHSSGLTPRDREICEAIGPSLKELGLIFTGIDIIGGCLTEINVTSPTGLQEIGRFDNTSLEEKIWEAIERIYSEDTEHQRPPL